MHWWTGCFVVSYPPAFVSPRLLHRVLQTAANEFDRHDTAISHLRCTGQVQLLVSNGLRHDDTFPLERHGVFYSSR